MNKISEIYKRKDKVKKFKLKVYTEIDKILKINRKMLSQFPISLNEQETKDWENIIKETFNLIKLKEYVLDSDSFLKIEARYEDIDYIVYQVSDEIIDIWMEKDHNFTRTFLSNIETYGFEVTNILNDRYFGHEFTNIYDQIIYKRNNN